MGLYFWFGVYVDFDQDKCSYESIMPSVLFVSYESGTISYVTICNFMLIYLLQLYSLLRPPLARARQYKSIAVLGVSGTLKKLGMF